MRTRASRAVPLGHRLSSTTGTRASSVVPLSRGINSAMGVRAPHAAPINHVAGAWALPAPPTDASRNNTAAVTASRHFRLTSSSPPLPDHAMAVGLRCGTADPQTMFLSPRWRSVRGVGRSTLKHRDICEARSGVCSQYQRALCPCWHQGGVDKIRYLVSLLQQSYQKRAFSGKTTTVTCPSPVQGDAHRVYGPYFVF